MFLLLLRRTEGQQLVGDKQALLANEKRRRRGESYNAVERRRRDNINEKTNKLATLTPQCMLYVEVSFSVFFFRFVIGAIVSLWRFWC